MCLHVPSILGKSFPFPFPYFVLHIYCLALNKGETKYTEIRPHRGMIANEHVRIGSNSYEKVKIFKYLGSLVTNQNSIHEEIKCRLKAEN